MKAPKARDVHGTLQGISVLVAWSSPGVVIAPAIKEERDREIQRACQAGTSKRVG